jgi:hypothetical protein
MNTKKGARYGYNEQFGQFLQAIKVYYQISKDNQEQKKRIFGLLIMGFR